MTLEQLIKQKSYEHPVYKLRGHPFVFLKPVFVFFLLAVLPYVFYLLVNENYPNFLQGKNAYPILVLGASAYYLSIWLFFFSEFAVYFLDMWIVTNDRLLNINQTGLFNRTVSELDLFKVQDVTSEVNGMVATFFNYGNVYIQTAGEKERFVFIKVPRPHQIRQRIIDLVEIDRKYHVNSAGQPPSAVLSEAQ